MLNNMQIKSIVYHLNNNEKLLRYNKLDDLYIKTEDGVRPYLTEFLWVELKLGNKMLTYMTSIPEWFFRNVEGIGAVYIPENIKRIAQGAFVNSGINTVIFNTNSSCYFGDSIFEGCKNLQKVTLSNGLTYISAAMFKNCSSLRNIDLPDSITRIGLNAFEGCDNITITANKRGKNNKLLFASKDMEFLKSHLVMVDTPSENNSSEIQAEEGE